MDCRSFERVLDDLSLGLLPASQRDACEAHAAECGDCRELLMLATLPEAGGETLEVAQLVESVLARTSGSVCEDTAIRLPALVDGALEPGERSLVDEHVAACAECRHLAAVLTTLVRELPRLAQVRPDERFVDDVLRRTLPVHVQLRRWWARTWPRWIHRPRFASEAAYVGLLVMVLIFATPGSPLEAVPRRALAAARRPVVSELPLQHYMAAPAGAVKAIAQSRGAERVGEWIAAGAGTADRVEDVATGAADGLATFWREAASLLGNDGEDAGHESKETSESNEENP